MNPRLVGISGPLQGTVLNLDQAEVTIGRDRACTLFLDEPSVSRQHCAIRRDGQSLRIRDLDSRNGTLVNGRPVHERVLDHGDQIELGQVLFLFLLHEEEVATAFWPVQLEDRGPVAGATVVLRREDARYLQPLGEIDNLPRARRIARDLDALLRISAGIASLRGRREIARQLLDSIFAAVPAERGAILLCGENTEDFAAVFTRDDQPFPVSRAIVEQVLRERVAVSSDSLVAVPLLLLDKPIGAICLALGKSAFDEEHLQLLAGIAGIAAVGLDNARRLEDLEGENQRLQSEINLQHDMIGEGPRMQEVYRFIAKAAPSDSTVLIRGESGTGKELAARAIHRNSRRAAGPFVAVNCSAIPEALLESEFFGHEKGAFTGAIAQKKGRLEEARGGTLFLDEIGELAPALQSKLLRVLQEREFQRVGGTRTIQADVRLIAATNRDLQQAVRENAFREDLYYRLNVVALTMPPLRDRREDIPILANYFAARHSKRARREAVGISPEARAALMHYDWPGNVRELENAIERAIVLGSADRILPEDLPETVLEAQQPPISNYHEAIREAKKELIRKTIAQAGGNLTQAAKVLGIHPNNLHRLMRELGARS